MSLRNARIIGLGPVSTRLAPWSARDSFAFGVRRSRTVIFGGAAESTSGSVLVGELGGRQI